MESFSSAERMKDLDPSDMDAETSETGGENMVVEEEMDPVLWSSLREELVEKIIARLPLKSLVQSQVLAKKWRSLIRNSIPFQSEVSSVSSRWGSYYPLYVSDKELMGFDLSTHRWQALFKLPEFPEDFCRGFSGPFAWTLSLCGVNGSLIILSYYSNHTLRVLVTNPINESFKRLPALDLTDDAPLDPRSHEWDDNVLVIPDSHFNYKVLVFTRNMAGNMLQVRVYHSEKKSWSEPQRGPVLPSDFVGLDSSCHLGKIFYLAFLKSVDESPCTLRSRLEDLMLFYTYDSEKGVLEQIVLPSPLQVPDVPIQECKLVVGGSELMLVVGQGSREQDEEQRLESLSGQVATVADVEEYNEPDLGSFSQEYFYIPKDSFLLFRLDPKSLELQEISRGPTEKLLSRTFTGVVVSDKDCIYLQTESTIGENEFGAVTFNLRQQTWSCLPLDSLTPCFDIENTSLTDFAFQPGLHPFAVA